LGNSRRYLAIRKFKPGDEAIRNNCFYILINEFLFFSIGKGKDDDGIIKYDLTHAGLDRSLKNISK
jgi:hypothetical protein